ncbi:Uncharacterised protein [Salmonella enterica subsp. enterica]|uniref:Uncharacterized protein n=1 Tax=Salmonella enterica I TaxID=59201 RepID=A0A3S4IX53_SALET|nr:Uncharacterised protein [Salmonella enterica subsp. enterica]
MVRNTARIKKARIREPFINALTYRLEMFSARYLATPSGEAFMPSLPFSHCAGQTSPWLFVELQSVDHTQHFVRCYDPAADRLRPGWRTIPLASIRKRAAQRNAFVRVFDTVSFLNFTLHVGDHCVFHRANAAFIDRGVTPCVVNETQSRKKRRPLQRRASGILHNVYQRRSAQTGKQK